MKKLLLALTILAAGTSPALAQNTADTASQATNTVNVVAVAGDTSESRMSGHVYGTPNVMGSSIIGSNNCLVGTGVGGAAGPIGLNISIGRSDKSCVRRMDAAALNGLGLKRAAIARMCQDEDTADAFWAGTGYVCPGVKRDRYKHADGTLGEYWAG